MDGLYVETDVKKKVTLKDNLMKYGLIAATVIAIGFGFLMMKVLVILVGFVLGALCYYFVPKIDAMYEYVFIDGQLDFDKILGGEKRKHVLRTDFDQLVVMAPKNSHSLDGYRHNGVEVKDFSSLYEDHRVYGIVFTSGEKSQMIYFEPDDKMIAAMKQKAPRKVMDY